MTSDARFVAHHGILAVCSPAWARWSGQMLIALAGVACLPRGAEAGVTGLTRVASGLSAPIFVTHAPNDRSRLFIVQRGGAIRILNLTTGLVTTPFLTIPGVDQGGEGGFLSMAFHPDYANNGKFYTYSTHDNGGVNVDGATSPFSTQIREWTVSANPNVANATSTTLISWPRPQDNHVGGWIGFSPNSADANLYISSGDGGNGFDNTVGHTAGVGNAQDITNNFMGKMLRINVDGDDFPTDDAKNYAVPTSNPFTAGQPNEGGDDEIWAYGLRNPFRASFDRATGDLWIGDVGQGQREEIDFQAADFAGGANYGWRLREGLIATNGGVGGGKPPGNVDPVYDYNRDADAFGGSVVTGGVVYRGPDPTLQGKYFFADSRNSPDASDDNYWTFDPADPFGTVANIDAQLTANAGSKQFPVAFGEDAVGNLYIAYIGSGEVFRVNTDAFQAGDFEGDADVDGDDLAIWNTGFGTEIGATRTSGDANADGAVDGADFLLWQQNLGWSALNVGSPTTGVPEPASAGTMIGLALAMCGACRRRANRD
jgi:glucose/arabinose dehydrogenase